MPFSTNFRDVLLVLLPVGGTLAGAWVSSNYAYSSAYQAAALSSQTACIARIDSQESILREKSDKFISSIGKLISYTTFNGLHDRDGLYKAAGPVIEQSYVLVSYAPLQLSNQAQSIAKIVQDISLESGKSSQLNNSDKVDELIGSMTSAYQKWPTNFQAALKNIDTDRTTCSKL